MPHSDAPRMEYTDEDQVVTVLKGAVTGRQITHPDRSFAFELKADLVKGREFFTRKPPVHFHVQEEYIETLEGKLGLELEGKELVLTPADGAFTILPYVNHRSYPMPESQQDGGTVVRFLLSGEKTPDVFSLDTTFFENWYKYQDDVAVNGAAISLFQLFSTFDAGGTYVSFPSWVPFGQTISQTMGVVFGRWIGGVLGYQPFHRKWTTNWDLACQKMESSFFQRRFADRSKTE